MGIFYEADETESDEEYKTWFEKTLKDIQDFNDQSRKTNLKVGKSLLKAEGTVSNIATIN